MCSDDDTTLSEILFFNFLLAALFVCSWGFVYVCVFVCERVCVDVQKLTLGFSILITLTDEHGNLSL